MMIWPTTTVSADSDRLMETQLSGDNDMADKTVSGESDRLMTTQGVVMVMIR